MQILQSFNNMVVEAVCAFSEGPYCLIVRQQTTEYVTFNLIKIIFVNGWIHNIILYFWIHAYIHTSYGDTNVVGQMLSPPRLLTSTLRSVAEIASPASRGRASMSYVESWGQRYNPPGAWPESSRGTDNGAAL